MDIVAALLTVAVVAASSSNGDNNDNGDGDGNGDDNTTITGTVSAGKYISGSTNDSIKVYKADGTGTTSAIGSSSLNEKGQYTITLTGDNANYTGAVYIKLIKSGIQHADELRGSEALDSMLAHYFHHLDY
jgi:DNA/RNA endonuclease YhcR with UshA esterase domain